MSTTSMQHRCCSCRLQQLQGGAKGKASQRFQRQILQKSHWRAARCTEGIPTLLQGKPELGSLLPEALRTASHRFGRSVSWRSSARHRLVWFPVKFMPLDIPQLPKEVWQALAIRGNSEFWARPHNLGNSCLQKKHERKHSPTSVAAA